MTTTNTALRVLDRSTLVAIVAIVIVLAYLNSHGGLGKFLSRVGIDRTPRVVVSSSLGAPIPPVDAPTTPSRVGSPFPQPIEASIGADTPFIRPMSATPFGAIPLQPADLTDPAKAGLVTRDADGFTFIGLPDVRAGAASLAAGGRAVQDASTTPVPDIFHSLTAWLFPSSPASPTPRIAAVS